MQIKETKQRKVIGVFNRSVGSYALALLSRLEPWYRYTDILPVFTCRSISFFQWWIREAGQMTRVPLEDTMLESGQRNKQ